MERTGQGQVKKNLAQEIEALTEILNTLRGPGGCPWDRRQRKEDIGKYLIDEAYEVIDAIDEGRAGHLKEELGDLLFHIFFLARMAEEQGEFDMADVVRGISEKMTRRHPHVFGDRKVTTVADVKQTWQDIKREERKGKTEYPMADIGEVGKSLPSLLRAFAVTDRASEAGFDWERAEDVIDKIDEEMGELKRALAEDNSEHIADEMGDIFLSLVNLCRFLKVNPEITLNASTRKFIKRFSFIENQLKKQGMSLPGASMEEMDRLWNMSKKQEKK